MFALNQLQLDQAVVRNLNHSPGQSYMLQYPRSMIFVLGNPEQEELLAKSANDDAGPTWAEADHWDWGM